MHLTTYAIWLVCGLSTLVAAWGKDDHEIFRLRDEVSLAEGPEVTFYDFLDIKPGATQEEITKAFRKKSRLLHPDKAKQTFIASYTAAKAQAKSGKQTKPGVRVTKGPSDAEIRRVVKTANERFARLGVVTNILRGPGRERYDHFLKNGFPKWRGTGYYYARYRPGLGAVLLGLFVVGGGAAHYVALYLGWKRQREFVGRYIRHARRAAWGDETGIKGLPPMDGSSASGAVPTESGEMEMQSMNRRQRRMQERENKKTKGFKASSVMAPSESTTGSSGPTGDRKRVVAENGKVLIVDSVGNVYLEEENEEGRTEEYLLDVNEIQKPTIRQTVLFRLPVWLMAQVTERLRRPARSTSGAAEASSSSSSESDNDEGGVSVDAEVPSAPNGGGAGWRAQKGGKGRSSKKS
ncbi:MAG: hypothetical protein M1823_002312 [Watsoniomyces obsoletus]|nr:MAG: hypothetical protein M1823_002312 [Watsoniomyces obsoletus]